LARNLSLSLSGISSLRQEGGVLYSSYITIFISFWIIVNLAISEILGIRIGKERKKQAGIVVLMIIIPISLLIGHNLLGTNKPTAMEPERVAVAPVVLSVTRLTESGNVNKVIQSNWTDGNISITTSLIVYSYREKSTDPPFDGHDGLVLKVSVNISSTQSFTGNIKVSFHPLDENATIFLSEERWSLHLDNTTLVTWQWYGTNKTGACIEAEIQELPCSINNQAYYVFLDEDGDHELKIIVEVNCTNEKTTKTITIPINLRTNSAEE